MRAGDELQITGSFGQQLYRIKTGMGTVTHVNPVTGTLYEMITPATVVLGAELMSYHDQSGAELHLGSIGWVAHASAPYVVESVQHRSPLGVSATLTHKITAKGEDRVLNLAAAARAEMFKKVDCYCRAKEAWQHNPQCPNFDAGEV